MIGREKFMHRERNLMRRRDYGSSNRGEDS